MQRLIHKTQLLITTNTVLSFSSSFSISDPFLPNSRLSLPMCPPKFPLCNKTPGNSVLSLQRRRQRLQGWVQAATKPMLLSQFCTRLESHLRASYRCRYALDRFNCAPPQDSSAGPTVVQTQRMATSSPTGVCTVCWSM